jgi:hypothetical protein
VDGKGGKREQWGLGKGTKNGVVYSKHGAGKGRSSPSLYKGSLLCVRVLFLHL